jgi:hypothetical protein
MRWLLVVIFCFNTFALFSSNKPSHGGDEEKKANTAFSVPSYLEPKKADLFEYPELGIVRNLVFPPSPAPAVGPLYREFVQFKVDDHDLMAGNAIDAIDDTNRSSLAALANGEEAERVRAFDLLAFVEEKGRFTDQLDAMTVLDLPVGIKKTIGNLEYTVLIDSIVMLPTYSYLRAYMAFTTPDGKKLAFRGDNIRFSRKGGLAGDARLELLGDHSMKMSEKMLLILKGEGKTYVEWDCFGFKNMGLDAEIEFSRDLFVPDTETGTPGEGRVRARFTTSLSSWDDLIAEVNMEPFQVAGLKGVGFTVKSAIFDYSSIRFVPGIVYPNNYKNASYDPSDPAFWQGFYLSELSVRLPKQFRKEGSNERIGFAAYNVIIDDMGFSGVLEAQNVLGDGQMDKWPFTVNTLSVKLVANQIEGAGFEGLITVPIDKENPFQYTAIINPGDEYLFSVSPSKNMKFEFLKTSEVEIYRSSFIEVKVKDSKFLPKAHLNGKLSIKSGEVKLTSLSFEKLVVQTVKPYVKVGGFSLGVESKDQSLGSFKIALENIGVANMDDPNEMGIKIGVAVMLVGEDADSYSATGGFILVGKVNDEGKDWKYDRLEISKLGLNIKAGPIALKGSLEWFKNDDTYGNGIRGEVEVEVIKIIKVEAVALFGKKNDLRFWFFDALATIPGGIGTGVVINSFGGGAFFHMKQSMDGSGSYLGESLSGITYVPDAETYFGLKATVFIATAGSDKLFNGDATLEITFNNGGGIRMIDFKGNGYFMTDPLSAGVAALKEKTGGLAGGAAGAAANAIAPGAQVAAHIHINYDVPNKTLHGNFEIYVNIIGGIVKGIGANNRAGWVVFHIAPSEWYIHAGSPEDPLGLDMLFGVLKTKSYFMVGDYIPGSPPPPDKVSEILGGIDLDYMAGMNTLASGKGMAFGARVEFDTGELKFMMFYSRFQAGMGFDIMIKDYGSAACVGSSGPVGINGWYANGQAFAYFDGTIGIIARVFGKKKNVHILSLAAATVLQAKLPNPFWMRGVVGGRFNVLGGLVKGDCKFEVTLGEECVIQGGSVMEGIEVIADVTPAEGTKEVSVFNASQGVFNMAIGEIFEMIDLDEKKKAFRIKLDHFKLLDGDAEIPGTLEWNYTNDVLAFNPIEILPPEKSIKALVQVSFEQQENGVWTVVKVDGNPYVEKKEVSFVTGTAPSYIPLDNVEYSYPVISQYNFYNDESNQGYVKLKTGQGYLFEGNSEFIQKGRFKAANGEVKYFDISYSTQQINFSIPTGLSNSKIYAFEFVNLPKNGPGAIDVNVSTETSSVAGGEGQELEIETKTAEGSIDILQEKLIYETFVRTSQYNKFSDKINAMTISKGWSWPIYTGIHELGVNVDGNELFDDFEINGFKDTDPLVEFEAVLADNNWYQTYVKSLIYPSYPPYGLTISWRNPDRFGVPPVKAVYIDQDVDIRRLTEEEVLDNTTQSMSGGGVFVYNLPLTIYRDYYEFQQQASVYLMTKNNTWMENLIKTPFPGIRSGDYKMYVKYKLPGIDKVTSHKLINIHVN